MDHSKYSKIPVELKVLRNWVCFRLECRKGKMTKVPYTPSGSKARANDPSTWAGFENCLHAITRNGFDGLGFELTPPYIGVDLDKCRSIVTGMIDDSAQKTICRLSSYTEVSVSGTGVHIIVKGALPLGRRRKGTIEMYDSGRYFTVSGNHLERTPLTIEERTSELIALHSDLFPPIPSEPRELPSFATVDDDEVLRRASSAANGGRFSALWRGDWEVLGYHSHSEADAALCTLLAFWVGSDEPRIDRLFRQSGLYRSKWDRDGYRRRTISRAITIHEHRFSVG